jgi:hypothetical protein
MGISVEFGVTTVNGSSTMFISTKEMDESMLDFFSTSSEIHELLVSFVPGRDKEAYITTTGRTFDLEVLAVVLVESLQTTISLLPIIDLKHSPLNQEQVDGEPDRSSPIGITTKHPRSGITGPVSNTELFPIDIHREGVFVVMQRHSASQQLSFVSLYISRTHDRTP